MTAPHTDRTRIYKIVGERIRDARRRQNITQEELASNVGLTRTSITNVENGRQKLLLHTLIQIADTLSTSPASLLATFEPKLKITMPDDLARPVRNWIMHSIGSSGTKPRSK